MRILMLNRFDIYSLPGTVRMVNLAEQMVKKGHTVTLAYYPSEERRRLLPLLRKDDPIGVETIQLDSHKSKLLTNIQMLRGIARRVDIIHFQKCFPETALLALWLAWLEDKPVHYDWDDHETAIVPEWTQSTVIRDIINYFEMRLPALTDSLSYTTETVHQLSLERGARPEFMIPAPVGADIDQFNPHNDGAKIRKKYGNPPHIILYIGQLEGGSYAELLLQAAQIALKKDPHLCFLIVGGGNKLPELMNTAKELGISDNVIFTNYILHAEIPDYVAAADICIACFEDNLITRCKSPLKVAEYLAAGKPIIASGVGDVPKMVSGAGKIVPPGNSEALANAIIDLLQHPEQIPAMKVNARRKSETEYNWSVIADRFLELYNKVISHR